MYEIFQKQKMLHKCKVVSNQVAVGVASFIMTLKEKVLNQELITCAFNLLM